MNFYKILTIVPGAFYFDPINLNGKYMHHNIEHFKAVHGVSCLQTKVSLLLYASLTVWSL